MSDSFLNLFPSYTEKKTDIPSDEFSLTSLFKTLSDPVPALPPPPAPEPVRISELLVKEAPPSPFQEASAREEDRRQPLPPETPPEPQPPPQQSRRLGDVADFFKQLSEEQEDAPLSQPPVSTSATPPAAEREDSFLGLFPSAPPSQPSLSDRLDKLTSLETPTSGTDLGDINVVKEEVAKAKKDPVARQELLKKINTEYQAPVMTPINPVTDFSNWWQKYKDNVNEPIREAWEDESWFRPAHIGLAYLTTPFTAMTSAVTTTAGFQKAPMITDAFSQYAAAHNFSNVGGYLAIMAGMGLDFLADPFNIFSVAPKAEYKLAQEYLKRAPSSAYIGEAEKALQVERRAKQARFANPKDIETIAAPQIALDNARAALGEAAERNPMFAEIADFTHGSQSHVYRNLVEQAKRNPNLEEFTHLPDNFNTPLSADPLLRQREFMQKMDSLAKHEVQVTRAAIEGAPVLRVFGNPVQFGGYRIPSPFTTFQNLASRAAGTWEKARLPVETVTSRVTPEAAGRMREWVQSALGRTLDDAQWEKFALHDLEAFLQQSQIGMRQKYGIGQKAASETAQTYPGLLFKPNAVRSWVYSYTKDLLNPADKTAVVQNMIDMYDLLIDAARTEPKAAWKTTADQLQQGRNAMEEIMVSQGGIEEFVKRRNEKYYRTRDVVDPATGQRVKQIVKDATGAPVPRMVPTKRLNVMGEFENVSAPRTVPQPALFYKNRMEQTLQDLQQAFGEYVKPGGLVDKIRTPATSDADKFTDVLAESVAAQRRDLPGMTTAQAESVVSMFERLKNDHDLLTRSARSYPYDVFDAMSRRDVGALMDQIQTLGNDIKMFTDDFFVNAEGSLTGVAALGKMMNTPGGAKMLESWWKTAAPRAQGASKYERITDASGNVTSYTDLTRLSPTEVAAARSEIARGVQKLLDDKLIDQSTVDGFETLLQNIGDDKVGDLLYSMANLAQTKLKTNVRARVMSAMAAPYKAALEKAEAMIRTTHADELRQIFNMYGRYQDHFTPHQIFDWAYQPGGIMDRIDRLHEKTFRTMKFSPRAFETLQNSESKKIQADMLSEEYAREFSEKHVLPAAARIDSKYAADVPLNVEAELNEAYGQIVSCRQSMAYDSPMWDKTIGNVNGMKWSEYVRAKATREVEQGYERLNRLFGVTDGSRTKADQFLKIVNHEAKYREILKKESKAGMVGLGRVDYVNYKLIGNGHDYDNWLDYMKEAEDLVRESGPLAVKTYGHGEQRRFLDVAEVMAYTDKINQERKIAGKLPLNLQPVYNISALLGERYHNHLTGIVNRETLHELSALLPDHVRMFTFKPKSPNWKDVGELIPSMRGQDTYVNTRMFDYLQNFVPPLKREKEFWDVFVGFNQYLTRLSTNFSLVHLKNQIALAAIAGMEPELFGKWVKYMWDNRNMSQRIKAFSPVERMRYAVESHPMYKEAVANGLTHFRGDVAFRTTAENVMETMNPSLKWWEKTFGYRKGRGFSAPVQGPFSGLVFDVVDRGMKMALYEKFRMRGLTPRKAVELVNLHMIDYSARMLNPNVKRIGYALFPFFSWHVGNAMLHIPNILQNPRMYSMIKTAENFMNHAYSPYAGFPPDQVPAMLAHAVATPNTDRNGYQEWIMPEIPGQAHLNLLSNVMKNPFNPFYVSNEVARFVITRSRIGNLLYNAINPYERNKLRSQDIFSYMLGDADRPGYIDETMWGLSGPKEFVKLGIESLTNPDAWSDAKYIAMNMFMRTEPMDFKGRIRHREQYKQVLYDKLGLGEE